MSKHMLRIALIMTVLPTIILVGLTFTMADNPGAADKNERLLNACKEERLQDVKHLLDKGAHVNAKTNNGRTALAAAAEKNHKEIRDLLIKRGATE